MNRKILILAMFLITLGGWMLHYRIHPIFVAKEFSFSHGLASIFSLLVVVLITTLFCFRKTVVYGFLLKGIFAIVLMGHFSIVDLSSKNPKFLDWIFKSTLPDIFVALGGLFDREGDL